MNRIPATGRRRRRPPGAMLIGTIVWLSSCASVGENFQLDAINHLRVGETTMSLARMELGPPFVEIDVAEWRKDRVHFGDESTVALWRYLYARGTLGHARARFLQVEFDSAGKVSDYYYASDFGEDGVAEARDRDFDLFVVRERVIPGKTTRAEVTSLLGESFRLMTIHKPGVAERRHYEYSAKLPADSAGSPPSGGKRNFGKSVAIDFDARGIVVDVRGESDFPADLRRSRQQ